jgi:arginyl-tRNA--protein-N-Asp/Glu arginylyltransferase
MQALYTVWDPAFEELQLVRFMWMQELHLAKRWYFSSQTPHSVPSSSPNAFFRGMKYVDSGWYIRTSTEMKYKDSYEPVELFCPIYHKWVVLTRQLKDKLDVSPNSALADPQVSLLISYIGTF